MIEDDKSKLSTGNESADILFCCETFEVIVLDGGAALLFRSFTGHHIEFRTNTIKPIEKMVLKCEGVFADGISRFYGICQSCSFKLFKDGAL